ncbi:delta-endotoxin CytB [Marasmius fiardii PR-910]|nr:delta-endotoxin CytB [Marasmius fiardii PR-910]
MTDDKHPRFEEFSKLPESLIPTALQVARFAQHYIEFGSSVFFKWSEFKEAVNNYPGDDLEYDGFSNNRINQQGQTVEALVDKIVDYTRVVLNVNLTATDIAELTRIILNMLTNLEGAQKNNLAHFNNTGTDPHWLYKILFAFPNPDLPDYFYSLVMTIKLQKAVGDEAWWFRLAKETKGDISADIDAMRLIVKKGFRDPQN